MKGLHNCFFNFQGIRSRGCDVCSTYRHARTLACTHTSCSDMFRLFVLLLFVQPAAREVNSTERKEAKEDGKKRKNKRKYCQNTSHSLTNAYAETLPVNFCFSRGQIQPCGFVCSLGNQTGPKRKKEKKQSQKNYQSVFIAEP